MKTNELTVLEYAKLHGKTLDWIYKQCRLGKLPAILKDGRWKIVLSGESTGQQKQKATV